MAVAQIAKVIALIAFSRCRVGTKAAKYALREGLGVYTRSLGSSVSLTRAG